MYSGTYLLNPFRSLIFGQSLLLRVQPELMTGAELYALAWGAVRRFLRAGSSEAGSRPGSLPASRAASPSPSSGDADDSDASPVPPRPSTAGGQGFA